MTIPKSKRTAIATNASRDSLPRRSENRAGCVGEKPTYATAPDEPPDASLVHAHGFRSRLGIDVPEKTPPAYGRSVSPSIYPGLPLGRRDLPVPTTAVLLGSTSPEWLAGLPPTLTLGAIPPRARLASRDSGRTSRGGVIPASVLSPDAEASRY